MSAPVATGDPPSAMVRAVYRSVAFVVRALCRVYWRLEIRGRERLPSHGAYVVAPVHRSYVDFALAGLAIDRQVQWVAKREVFVGGMIDRFLLAFGAIPANRDGVDRSAISACDRVLGRGQPVVVFPEGRRRDGVQVEKLMDGPAFLACRHRVPIVPVGIGGSDRAMPRGARFIYPRKVVVTIGEPLYPDVGTTGRVPRSVVAALTDELHSALQELYDTSRSAAGV